MQNQSYQFEHSIGAAAGQWFRLEISDYRRGQELQAEYQRGAALADQAQDQVIRTKGRVIMKRAVAQARKIAN